MTDNWDDGDEDEWDVDDDALDAKLGLKKGDDDEPANNFDDEEDLALKEKAAQEKVDNVELKKKGSALAAKKKAEEEQKEKEEFARRILEEESAMMSKLSLDEQKEYLRKREMENDIGLLDDSYGGGRDSSAVGAAQHAGDTVALNDMKDHLKHARKVAEAMKAHGNIHWAALFIKETLEQGKDVLDDDAITDIIKTCNIIKNEKVQAAKRKVKGQPQKSKKQDKVEKIKAKQLQDEVFGDNNQYDVYDEIGESYEDSFF